MAVRKTKVRISRRFWSFLRMTLGKALIKRFSVQALNIEEVRKIRPPYFIMPNHVGFWDPFVVAAFLDHPVHYVVSRFQFDKLSTRFLLSLVGGIPKSKMVSDFETIRTIMDIKKQGGIIGVYPEGSRNWDGKTLPIIRSTAKLVKLLKIPVICPLQKGGFFTQPRWARKSGRGRISIDYKIIFRGPELKNMSADDIADTIQAAIDYDENKYHAGKHVQFKNPRSAENIEQMLFLCPECGAYNSMFSKGDTFVCRECGTRFRYNSECRIEGGRFGTLTEWNGWQLGQLEAAVRDRMAGNASDELFRSRDITFISETPKATETKHPEENSPGNVRVVRKRSRGDLVYCRDRVEFLKKGKAVTVFKLDDIFGHNVQNREALEFYTAGGRFLAMDKKQRFSGYLWMNAIEFRHRVSSEGKI